jgi:membrane fusion protein, multidrug efflux system
MNYKKTYSLLAVIILFPGCKTGREQPGGSEAPVAVVTSPVKKLTTGSDISLSGNIEGNKTVKLGFLVAGRIDFIAADEGERVSRDKVIASIEPTSYAIARELAGIQVDQVQDEYDRLKSMHDNKSVSESDFAKISFGLQQAKAQLKLHTKNLADTKLYSPIDGIVLKKLAEVGEITGSGIPVLVVSDIRRVKVSAYIPETELHSVKIGMKASVSVSSADKIFEGTIAEVGSLADPSSRSFLLRIVVDNPGMLLRPGMIAGVTIPSGNAESFLGIGAGAVMHDFNNRSYVFVADSVRKKAFRRNVITGSLSNDIIEITSGLSEGEPVVTGGYQKLVDGCRIIINK